MKAEKYRGQREWRASEIGFELNNAHAIPVDGYRKTKCYINLLSSFDGGYIHPGIHPETEDWAGWRKMWYEQLRQ